MANGRGSGQYWGSVEPWRLLVPLALKEIMLLESGGSGGVAHLLYAWWIPGLLFGLASSATLRFKPHTVLAFSTVTGAIFAGAGGNSGERD